MNDLLWNIPRITEESFTRMPGLFRRWEISRVLENGWEYHIEEGGTASDGTQLFAVFRRKKLDDATIGD